MIVQTQGETITVLFDGKEVSPFASEGNAHPKKSLVCLATTINDMHYDDFSIRAAPSGKESQAE